MSDQSAEYVFNGTLVTKTGRVAKKTTNKETLRASRTVEEQIVEIVPVDIEDGTWKRWVAESDLFIVQ